MLRKLILAELSNGNRTINQISVNTGINWRTVEAHLEFLAAQGDAAELLNSEYVRIFAITRQGAEKLGIEAPASERKLAVTIAAKALQEDAE